MQISNALIQSKEAELKNPVSNTYARLYYVFRGNAVNTIALFWASPPQFYVYVVYTAS